MSVNGNRNHYRSFYGFDIHLMWLEFLLSIIRAQDDEAYLGNISWLFSATTNFRQIPLDRHGVMVGF